MPLLVVSCLTALLLLPPGGAVSSLGFEAPFNVVDATGERTVPEWSSQGDARVLQNFVRLTHAKPDRSGALWSTRNLGVDEFSALFRFRMSGPDKTNFGDGLALWFVQSPRKTGPFHGFVEQFTGVGIIFNNYHDPAKRGQKDVMLAINDGTRTAAQMEADQLGCTALMRYHEERADFSVFNATRVSVSYKQGTLTIGMDARNLNDWVECVTVRVHLGDDWLRTARLGLTATTSSVRKDNHDVVSLKVFPYAEDIQTAGIEDVNPPDRNTLEHLVQHLEHQLVAVQASLQTNIQTVQEQEKKSQERIQRLEESLSLKIMGLLEARVKALESLNLKQLRDQEAQAEDRIHKLEETLNSQVHRTMEGRVQTLEGQIAGRMKERLEDRIAALERGVEGVVEQRLQKLEDVLNERIGESVNEMAVGAQSWVIPFVVLGFGVSISMGLVYNKYYRIQKLHVY